MKFNKFDHCLGRDVRVRVVENCFYTRYTRVSCIVYFNTQKYIHKTLLVKYTIIHENKRDTR